MTELDSNTRVRIAIAHLLQWTPLRKNVNNPKIIVFPEHKIAYIPVPKAANSSVRAALLPLIGKDPSSIEDIQAFRGFEQIRYKKFRQMRDENWYVFTVVRNPFSRYSSGYLNKIVTRDQVLKDLVKMGMRKGDSFGRFMEILSKWPQRALNRHFAPQSLMLEHAVQDRLKIFKMESLAEDWPMIATEIETRTGITIGAIEQRNKSPVKMTNQSLYNDETRAIARSLGERDFAMFGYSPQIES